MRCSSSVLWSISALALAILLPLAIAHAQLTGESGEPREEFLRTTVLRILEEKQDASIDGMERTVQTVVLRIIGGPDDGQEFTVENSILGKREDMQLQEGETVVVRKLVKADGTVDYLISEKYRLNAVLWLSAFFLALTFVLGGWTGLRSLFGLLLSVLILALFVVPQIAAGRNPMLVSLVGSCAIACTSLYLAHGLNRRTSVALLSTLLTLGIAVLLSLLFVHVAKLFGMGSEDSMYLQIGQFQNVNLRGLLLGGIIIGCLGVLDDVTTAQTAAVDEIRKANPSLSSRALMAAGLSVGREHIASLVNTLALAYVGASLPLLLLLTMNEGYPLWVTLNSEFLSEEIIRTLVGSATLLFAVPISTWFAAKLLVADSGSTKRPSEHLHSHYFRNL